LLNESVANENVSGILSLLGISDQGGTSIPIKFESSDPLGSRIIAQDEDASKLSNRLADSGKIPEALLSNALT